MAELSLKERLQPSLLDRLTDEEPDKHQETREKRVLSLKRLRECVLRDLGWLLNSSNLSSTEDLSDYPEVANSVLDYGLPDLAGVSASSIDIVGVERCLRDSILRFEPRILSKTLKIRINSNPDEMSHNALVFEIEGELWAQPVPLHVLLKTELDLESGDVNVTEFGG